jgi:5'-deoxynucleotidase YfbR-like HD superfamily hydrolase
MSKTRMMTYSGKYFIPGNPQPDQICIEDIAHALAAEPRYNGHTRYPYSVAQHSVNAFRVAPRAFRREALLHDATEAYMKDIPTALKNLLSEYQRLEENLYNLLARMYRFPADMSPQVKEVDMRLLVTEAAALFPADNRDRWWVAMPFEPYPTPPVSLSYWESAYAEDLFRDAFYQCRDDA